MNLSCQVNPFVGTAFSWQAVGLGCLGALPIFLVSVLLEKSGVDFFRKIDQDTKLYVVQVFGATRNWPVRHLTVLSSLLLELFPYSVRSLLVKRVLQGGRLRYRTV